MNLANMYLSINVKKTKTMDLNKIDTEIRTNIKIKTSTYGLFGLSEFKCYRNFNDINTIITLDKLAVQKKGILLVHQNLSISTKKTFIKIFLI